MPQDSDGHGVAEVLPQLLELQELFEGDTKTSGNKLATAPAKSKTKAHWKYLNNNFINNPLEWLKNEHNWVSEIIEY
jgi:hypothetical protein